MGISVPVGNRWQLLKKISVYLLLIGMAALILFIPIPQKTTVPVDRYFEINASTFQFAPGELTVNPGDRVTIKLISNDVVHGFSLDNSEFELKAEPGQPAVGTFIAEHPGVLRFRCTVTCGNLHPFMLGKLRVGSNFLLIRGIVLGIFAGRHRHILIPANPKATTGGSMNRVDITRFPWAKALLRNRWPQFLLRAITLAGFIFTILAGLFGSVVGSHNFAIIFVWIAWWTALKLFFIPLGGRSWCSICPIPMPGEWLQQGGILQPRGRNPSALAKPLAEMDAQQLDAGRGSF